ncbi:putative Ig domain-containing protein [Zobellia nedashkovskayae]
MKYGIQKKINAKWTEPEIFQPLKGISVFLPYFTPDDKSLLFAQSIPGTNDGSSDIWIIEKINDSWGSPKKMQAPIRSKSREANASMTNEGTIYFSSNRNCEGKENCFTADLFYSLGDNTYQNVEAISALNSLNDEESVFISPKEDYILFCRFTDNIKGVDLYLSYRDSNKNWLTPILLDAAINTNNWERRPFVTNDNKFLFFTQLQIGATGLTESDIFWVNTSKVFMPFVYQPLSDITAQVGEKFEINIPLDYFKDIDNELLKVSLDKNELDWLEFDAKKRKLSGVPPLAGEYKVTFSAVDIFLNRTRDTVILRVKK